MSAIHLQQASVQQQQAPVQQVSEPSFFSRVSAAVTGEFKQRCSNVAENLKKAAQGDISFLKDSIPVVVAGAILSRLPTAESCYLQYKGVAVPTDPCCENLGANYLGCAVDYLKTLPSDMLSDLLSQRGITLDQYNQATAGRTTIATSSPLLTTTAAAPVATTAGGVPVGQAHDCDNKGLIAGVAVLSFVSALSIAGNIYSSVKSHRAAGLVRTAEVNKLRTELTTLHDELSALLPDDGTFRQQLENGIIAARRDGVLHRIHSDPESHTALVRVTRDALNAAICTLTLAATAQKAWGSPLSDKGRVVIDAAKQKLLSVRTNDSVVKLRASVKAAAEEIMRHQDGFDGKDQLRAEIERVYPKQPE